MFDTDINSLTPMKSRDEENIIFRLDLIGLLSLKFPIRIVNEH